MEEQIEGVQAAMISESEAQQNLDGFWSRTMEEIKNLSMVSFVNII